MGKVAAGAGEFQAVTMPTGKIDKLPFAGRTENSWRHRIRIR